MSIKAGYQPFIGVGIEATPGSAVVASKYLPHVTCTIRGIQEVLFDESAKGIREKNWGAVAGPRRGEGDLEIYVDAENAPYLIYAALGSISSGTASGESAVYEHTITRKANNPPKTLTIIYFDGVDTRKYTYATINTLEINVSDSIATISANILSKFPSTGTGTQAITEERILAFKDYSIQFGSGANGTAALAAAAGASASALKSLSLRINNNAEAHYLSGDNSPAQIAIKQLEIEGDYVLFYETTEDRVHYETLEDGGNAVRAMIITFTGDSIGSAETEEIKISIPNFTITDRGVDTAVAGFITENPSFVANYDPTETKIIEVIVTNEHSSY